MNYFNTVLEHHIKTMITNGTITISDASIIMIRIALLSRIRNPGQNYTRDDMFLQDIVKTTADQELIEVCYNYMLEISAARRNSNDGIWSWKSPIFLRGATSKELGIICEVCGCWLRENYLYTNQNHEMWW